MSSSADILAKMVDLDSRSIRPIRDCLRNPQDAQALARLGAVETELKLLRADLGQALADEAAAAQAASPPSTI